MNFDIHTHHRRCGHAEGDISDYIEAAIEQGMDVIGISDHSPYFYSEKDAENPRVAMPKSEFPHYINEILSLKEKYKDKIEVLVGVESDFFVNHVQLYQRIYHQYPFDYIIGSVHFTDGISIFKKDRWDGLSEEELLYEKELYYQTIQQSAMSGMFDILGHIDGMKRFFPYFFDIKTNEVENCLRTIAECDIAIEVNTSGTEDLGWQTFKEILEMAHFYDIKVTLGSDAHKPERVGHHFSDVKKHLKEIGFTELAIFRKRKRVMVPL